MVESLTHKPQAQRPASTIEPMPFWQVLLYFGVPALLFRASLYGGIPALIHVGLARFEASVVGLTIPAAALFALAFGCYRRDGYPLAWSAVRSRFRLFPPTRAGWAWALGGWLATFLSIGALAFTAPRLISALPGIAPPEFFPPWLRPGAAFDLASFAAYIGKPVRGNWGVATLFFVMLWFNIAGEELWWRGYILPRQEAAHGRWAWLIHGLLWLAWHLAFYPWQALALLPICLAIPYIAQRRQNTWPALIIHTQNGLVLVLVLALVLGIA
jgi:membrane protease YdiL (CAAX protease family)